MCWPRPLPASSPADSAWLAPSFHWDLNLECRLREASPPLCVPSKGDSPSPVTVLSLSLTRLLSYDWSPPHCLMIKKWFHVALYLRYFSTYYFVFLHKFMSSKQTPNPKIPNSNFPSHPSTPRPHTLWERYPGPVKNSTCAGQIQCCDLIKVMCYHWYNDTILEGLLWDMEMVPLGGKLLSVLCSEVFRSRPGNTQREANGRNTYWFQLVCLLWTLGEPHFSRKSTGPGHRTGSKAGSTCRIPTPRIPQLSVPLSHGAELDHLKETA